MNGVIIYLNDSAKLLIVNFENVVESFELCRVIIVVDKLSIVEKKV